jgi:hypothetical protein
MVFVAMLEVYQSEVMASPGAKRSRQLPQFDQSGEKSVLSVAATVMAAGTLAGLKLQAWSPSLPAATTTVTPSAMSESTAASMSGEAAPPRLRLTTAGVPGRWSVATQSRPAMTPELVPLPEQSRTRTGTNETAFAMPYVDPPTVPATWVPWPLQSLEPFPSLTAVVPGRTRPPKSTWLAKIPVSMMYAVTPAPVLG